MTVIVITATIIGLASLSDGPDASILGGQFNIKALFSKRAMGEQYAMVPIPSNKSSVN